ncbi:MAG: hypothetical protein JXR84_09795 [Anaerolineae bacterium]|nr:hypothetical protein [Anaerolineae bacterium]
MTTYTAESVLASLGYADPLDAARQQARMILLGRRARYEARIQSLETKWGCSVADMRARYMLEGQEDFEADDDYVQWQWYLDALASLDAQIAAIS